MKSSNTPRQLGNVDEQRDQLDPCRHSFSESLLDECDNGEEGDLNNNDLITAQGEDSSQEGNNLQTVNEDDNYASSHISGDLEDTEEVSSETCVAQEPNNMDTNQKETTAKEAEIQAMLSEEGSDTPSKKHILFVERDGQIEVKGGTFERIATWVATANKGIPPFLKRP